MRVQITPPHQKQNNIPQCRRCQAYFHTKGYYAHRLRRVKCGKSHSTEQWTPSTTQPAARLDCGELHPASYRGCEVCHEIIWLRFASPRATQNIHFTSISRQKNENLVASQKPEGRPKMSYAQATRNSIDATKISENNTQEHILIKLMQESFTRFETILS
jgi:hypothetical protein